MSIYIQLSKIRVKVSRKSKLREKEIGETESQSYEGKIDEIENQIYERRK